MSQTLTAPYRPTARLGQRVYARLPRKVRLILFWAVTRQLHIQLGFWLRARRLRRAAPPAQPPALIGDIPPEEIDIPRGDNPVVSVIIPSCGHSAFTLRCLASIAAALPRAQIEVIVVDDAGPADDVACLSRVRGIRLLRNSVNLGFIGACNAASRAARGQYLLFLNNDTQVLPDWLDTMLQPFEARADVGAVGAMLLYPDGRLQEAGAIVWADGSGWNVGRLENQGDPTYHYQREVDYCSGACLLVARSVFMGLGGFDPIYTPAYYEDTDLCFRLRGQGLKTIYQPRAKVVHFEGISHGRDITAGVKSHQVTNHRTFLRRWTRLLEQEHYAPGRHVIRARDRAHGRQIVLVVDHRIPEPDRDAGSRAIFGCLEALLSAGLVVKFWPHDLIYNPTYTEVLQDMGIEVFHGPGHASFESWISIHGADIDHVMISRPAVAEDVLPMVRRHSRARVIYYGHDLHFRRLRQQGELRADARLLRQAGRMEAKERHLWRAADVALYLSEEEAAIARALEPAADMRAVVPYGFTRFAPNRQPPPEFEVIFVAGFGHPPNEEAACWMVAEVWPLVAIRVPEATLMLVGSNPTARVRRLARADVIVTGPVSEEALYRRYAAARVAVVPLRSGAGVKLKTVEAMVEGTPVVTTPIGAQGLPGLDRVASLESERKAFASAICQLLLDDALWEARSSAGLAYAKARFQPGHVRESLLSATGIAPSDGLAAVA